MKVMLKTEIPVCFHHYWNPLFVCATQARHVEGGSTGLIPSQTLEEKRKAFVKRDVELAPAGSLTPPNQQKTKQNYRAPLVTLD